MFWVSVPVLSEQSTIDAGELLDGREPAYDRLTFGKLARANGHGHRQHGRHGHGDCRDGEHQRELQRGHDGIATEQGDGEDEGHERNGHDDQIVADLEHRALEVADRVGLLDERCGLAEESVSAGGIDKRIGLALADDGAGIEVLSGRFRYRQGFAGQRRLIDL